MTLDHEPRAWIRLTYACNNRCLFCLDGDQNDPGRPVPLPALRKELARWRARGLGRVVLSGGEPTLHPRFVEIVRAASRMGYTHVQAISNGRRFCYPRFLKDCVGAGLSEITFSMHGHTPELYERLVGVPGSFPQALAGLTAALKVPGLIVSVDVVVNRLNIDVLDQLLGFYARRGVREFDLLHLVPFGRAWDNWRELSYDPARHGKALRRALSLSRKGIRLWTNRLPAPYLEGFEDLIQPPDKLHDEVRGRRAMFRDLLSRGARPGCQGARCKHCFMSGFCSDLRSLRRHGSLAGKPWPHCLPLAARNGEPTPFLTRGARAELLERFTSYFIENRYTVKGQACASCAKGRRCSGAPIRLIRDRGFRILSPIPEHG